MYNNFIIDGKADKEKKKINKKDSLCCANPNGNTLDCNVLDFVVDTDDSDKLNECKAHGIAKSIQSSFLAFKSPIVQQHIREWNSHYGDDESDTYSQIDDQQNKDGVQRLLNF